MLTRRFRLADFSPVPAEWEEVAGLRFRFLFSEVGEFDALNLASNSKCSWASSKCSLAVFLASANLLCRVFCVLSSYCSFLFSVFEEEGIFFTARGGDVVVAAAAVVCRSTVLLLVVLCRCKCSEVPSQVLVWVLWTSPLCPHLSLSCLLDFFVRGFVGVFCRTCTLLLWSLFS